MKRTYEAPLAEVVRFEYKDQVVVASGACTKIWENFPRSACTDPVHTGYDNVI